MISYHEVIKILDKLVISICIRYIWQCVLQSNLGSAYSEYITTLNTVYQLHVCCRLYMDTWKCLYIYFYVKDFVIRV